MRKWQSYYEILYFPLIILFIACILKNVGGVILSSSFQSLIPIENQLIISVAETCRYVGYYLIQFFPIIVLLKFLTSRFEDSVPIITGVVCYLLINIITMFFTKSNLDLTVYSSELGISINVGNLKIAGLGTKYPLSLGIIGIIITIYIVIYFYNVSRRTDSVGVFGFINKDAKSLIFSCLASIVAGLVLSYVWPYVIKGLYLIFDIIASDITNPMNLFVYGIVERIMTVLDLDNIIHNLFWFSERGGSWMYNGITYFGDIAVWTAQNSAGIYNSGFGRFITPYYVQSIFIIPAIIIATYKTFTDKFEKNKFVIFLIISVIFSIFFGNILPIEIYLLIMTPLFYVFHLFSTGLLYAFLQGFRINIGYSYNGTISGATPGGIIDLLSFIRNPSYNKSIILLFVIGLFFGVLYYFALMFYYKKGCMDILQTGKKEDYINSFVIAVGGLENIENIYSTPTKLIIQVEDGGLLNFATMQKQGACKIIQTRNTYEISFGAISYMLANEVIKLKNETKV